MRLTRNRDASHVIRGFVYQVDRTVIRWLNLQSHEHLELERGEDIDLITKSLAGSDPADVRLLEQVKHRASAVTLRSRTVIEALSNFLEHRETNVTLPLSFVFLTNAHIGRERTESPLTTLPGLHAWQRVRELPADDPANEALIAQLRALLLAAKRPKTVHISSWEGLRRFLERATWRELRSFVCSVEFVTSAPAATAMRGEIERHLVARGIATDLATAGRVYERLFVVVFQRLGATGIKRLTSSELRVDVEAALAGAGLPPVRGALFLLQQRLDGVEAKLQSMRGDLRAGMIGASEHLPPGDTVSFVSTASHFGHRLGSTPPFNHARPLLGREEVMTRARSAVEASLASGSLGVVVLGARGGMGKSRLLLEIARDWEPTVQVRWVRHGLPVTIRALAELPRGPLLLMCDDAQRQPELATLLAVASERRDPTVLCLGMRPYGRASFEAAVHGAQIEVAQIHDLGALPPIGRENLLDLLRRELGTDYEDLAEALLHQVQESVLVGLVAARLLRTRQVHPRLLSQDNEFRQIVLAGFRDEILGAVSDAIEPALAKRLVEVIAAIQPVRRPADELEARIAQLVGVAPSVLRRALGAMIDAGVLSDDGQELRVTPDVLSDFVLHGAMVAGGRSTGLDAELLSALGEPILVDLVRNVAELDWQRTEAGEPVNLFDASWEFLVKAFEQSSNAVRVSLLGRLQPVAAYQPGRLLALIEWLLEHPEGGDGPDGPFRLPTSNDEVIQAVPELLAITTQHVAYVGRALDLLWHLGQRDTRQTGPYPHHAIRELFDTVAYARRQPEWMQEQALDALDRWTRVPGWSRAPHSPLPIAERVFATAIIEDRFNDETNQLTMTRYPINAAMTERVRLRAISLLERLVTDGEPRGRYLALSTLLHALDKPDQSFGHVPSRDEEEAFSAQHAAALAAIERILAAGPSALARLRIKRALHQKARFTLVPGYRERMIGIYASIEDTADMRRMRAIAFGFPEGAPGVSLTDRRDAMGALRTAEVDALIASGSWETVWEAMNRVCTELDEGGERYNPSAILADLAARYPDVGASLVNHLLVTVEQGDGTRATWLTALLPAFRERDAVFFVSSIARAGQAHDATARWAAATTLGYVHSGTPWGSHDVGLIRTLLRDSDARVRSAALGALAVADVAVVAPLLPDVRLGGDVNVAQALGEVWSLRSGEPLPTVDEDTAKHLLAELVEVRDLTAAEYEVGLLIAALARSYPVAVVDFVIARITRELTPVADETFDMRDRYDAIPYGGFAGLQGALRESGQYEAIIDRIIMAVDDAPHDAWLLQHKMRDLLDVIGEWDPGTEAVLRHWADSGNCVKLKASAPLFAHLARDFVLSAQEFITHLLDAASCCGAGVATALTSALAAGALRGPPGGQWVGERDVVLERLASESAAIAAQASTSIIARQLYADIAAGAKEALSRAERRAADRRGSRRPVSQ